MAFDLCVAYLGAWFFNELVVVRPRKRQLRDAYRSCWYLLENVAVSGWWITDTLHRVAGLKLSDDQSEAQLLAVLKRIDPQTPSVPTLNLAEPALFTDSTPAQYVQRSTADIEDVIEKLAPLFSSLDADVTTMLYGLTTSNLVQLMRSLPADKFRTPTMEPLAKPLFDYWARCNALWARLEDIRVAMQMDGRGLAQLRSRL